VRIRRGRRDGGTTEEGKSENDVDETHGVLPWVANDKEQIKDIVGATYCKEKDETAAPDLSTAPLLMFGFCSGTMNLL
jgi:hypothetical protein